MNKTEALKLIKQQKGYVPYFSLFELFEAGDDIPQELVNVAMQKEKTTGESIIFSPKLAERIMDLQKKKNKV